MAQHKQIFHSELCWWCNHSFVWSVSRWKCEYIRASYIIIISAIETNEPTTKKTHTKNTRILFLKNLRAHSQTTSGLCTTIKYELYKIWKWMELWLVSFRTALRSPALLFYSIHHALLFLSLSLLFLVILLAQIPFCTFQIKEKKHSFCCRVKKKHRTPKEVLFAAIVAVAVVAARIQPIFTIKYVLFIQMRFQRECEFKRVKQKQREKEKKKFHKIFSMLLLKLPCRSLYPFTSF